MKANCKDKLLKIIHCNNELKRNVSSLHMMFFIVMSSGDAIPLLYLHTEYADITSCEIKSKICAGYI